jgi:hypothetical protein
MRNFRFAAPTPVPGIKNSDCPAPNTFLWLILSKIQNSYTHVFGSGSDLVPATLLTREVNETEQKKRCGPQANEKIAVSISSGTHKYKLKIKRYCSYATNSTM